MVFIGFWLAGPGPVRVDRAALGCNSSLFSIDVVFLFISSALPLSLSFSPSLASRMLVRSAPAGSRPPCPFRCSLRLLSLSMGSLGWADCYWCKRRHYNMYIPDGISQPLCEVCLDRWCDGLRPPRQPDARERLVRLLRPAIGCIPADIVAQLLRHDWEP